MKNQEKKILIVDDNRENAEVIGQLLQENGFATVFVPSGSSTVETALNESPDLILLEIDRPGKQSFEVARQLKLEREMRFIPIILLTVRLELDSKVQGLEAGVDDYITKPYSGVELLARIRSLLRVKSLNDHLDDAERVVFSLARIIEAKDPFTLGHADRVSRYAVVLGKLLDRKEADLETLEKGGALHDIGKMAVPDSILLKPGPLTSEEFEVMKGHPVVGYNICERLRSAKDALPLIRHHHEKLNGDGYPDHLKKDDIPPLVRIVNIVDIYDALTSARSYKDAWSIDKAFGVMYEEAKRGWWDGDLIRIWEKAVRSGELATFLSQIKNLKISMAKKSRL